jgi:hypothetical protein
MEMIHSSRLSPRIFSFVNLRVLDGSSLSVHAR